MLSLFRLHTVVDGLVADRRWRRPIVAHRVVVERRADERWQAVSERAACERSMSVGRFVATRMRRLARRRKVRALVARRQSPASKRAAVRELRRRRTTATDSKAPPRPPSSGPPISAFSSFGSSASKTPPAFLTVSADGDLCRRDETRRSEHLLPASDDGVRRCGVRPQRVDVHLIFLHNFEAGLVRVHVESVWTKAGQCGPLVDGLVVSTVALPPLLRQTVANLARRRAVEVE